MNQAADFKIRELYQRATSQGRMNQYIDEDGVNHTMRGISLQSPAAPNSAGIDDGAMFGDGIADASTPMADDAAIAIQEFSGLKRTAEDAKTNVLARANGKIHARKAEAALKLLLRRRLQGDPRLSPEEASEIGKQIGLTRREVRFLDTQLYAEFRRAKLGLNRPYTIFFEEAELSRVPSLTKMRLQMFFERVVRKEVRSFNLPSSEMYELARQAILVTLKAKRIHVREDWIPVLFNLALQKRRYGAIGEVAADLGMEVHVVRHILTEMRASLRANFEELVRLRGLGIESPELEFKARSLFTNSGLHPPRTGEGVLIHKESIEFALGLNDLERLLFAHRVVRMEWSSGDIASWLGVSESSVIQQSEDIAIRFRERMIRKGYPEASDTDNALGEGFAVSRTQRQMAQEVEPDAIEQINLFEAVLPQLAESSMSSAKRAEILDRVLLATRIVIDRDAIVRREQTIGVIRQTIFNSTAARDGTSDEMARQLGFEGRAGRNLRRRKIIKEIQEWYAIAEKYDLDLEDYVYFDYIRRTDPNAKTLLEDLPAIRQKIALMKRAAPEILAALPPNDRLLALHYVIRGDWTHEMATEFTGGWGHSRLVDFRNEIYQRFENQGSTRAQIMATRDFRPNVQRADRRRTPANLEAQNSSADILDQEAEAFISMSEEQVDQVWHHLLKKVKLRSGSLQKYIDKMSVRMAVASIIREAPGKDKEIFKMLFEANFFSEKMTMSLAEQAKILGVPERSLSDKKRYLREQFQNEFESAREAINMAASPFRQNTLLAPVRDAAEEIYAEAFVWKDVAGLAARLDLKPTRSNLEILRPILTEGPKVWDAVDVFIFKHRILRQDWSQARLGEELGVDSSAISWRERRLLEFLKEKYQEVVDYPLIEMND